MQINIATRHGHLSEPSQEKIRGKADRLTRYFDRVMSMEFVVDLSDEQKPSVDLLVSAEQKHDFVAHDKSENLMGSVDAVIQKMEQQLRKHKERIQGKHRSGEAKRYEAPISEEAGDE